MIDPRDGLPEDGVTEEERKQVFERKKTQRGMTAQPALKIASARGVTRAGSEGLNFSELPTVENAFGQALDTLENTGESTTVFYTDDASDVRLRVMKYRWVVEKFDPMTGKGGKGLCYGETEVKQVRKSGRVGNFFPVVQGF